MTDASSPPSTGHRAEKAFLATTSHEIRTPLNGILGTVSLLLETELDPAQREYAEAIRLSGSRLLDLLNNVLDYARLDAGELELETTTFDPVELAREVVELLAPRAHAAGIDVAVRARSPRRVTLSSDAGRVRQILFNLVGNALKFTEQGGVLVDVDAHQDGVNWTIIDTGPGIAPADQARLFDAFRQSSAEDAKKDGGVGLGLAIVKRLAEMLGGNISLNSFPGIGTAFTVHLPITPKYVSETGATDTIFQGRIALVGLPETTALAASGAFFHAGATLTICTPGARIRDANVILAGADLPSAEIARLAAIAPTLVVLRPEDRRAITKFRLLGCAGWLVRPLRPASLLERARLASAGNRDLGEDRDLSAGPGQRVLIADDNAVNALIAQRALEKSGFAVTLAGTGVEALEAVETSDFALILMDLRMPIMDGFTAMEHL
ncbi:MAG: ATP-binding protein, partial [Pseudomonadota bacterium]